MHPVDRHLHPPERDVREVGARDRGAGDIRRAQETTFYFLGGELRHALPLHAMRHDEQIAGLDRGGALELGTQPPIMQQLPRHGEGGCSTSAVQGCELVVDDEIDHWTKHTPDR